MAMFGSVSLIPAMTDDGSTKEIERAIRLAFTSILASAEGTGVIAPYKMNGTVTGHKVGDNIDAVRALIEEFRDKEQYQVIATKKVTDFRKSQILDAAIRPYQEIGKDGKLTGKPGPKMLKLNNQSAQA